MTMPEADAEGRRVTAGAVLVVGAVAVAVVGLLLFGASGLMSTINRTEPARVAVAVSTGEAVVVRTGSGAQRRAWYVPAQTVVVLPDGEFGRIEVLDGGCHLLDVLEQVRVVPAQVPWQVVLVTPTGVSIELPTGTPPPLPDAEETRACLP